MQRVQHTTASATLPAPALSGVTGYYTDGNPSTGTPATWLTAGNMNQLQEEIANTITASGQTLSNSDLTQLSAAVRGLAPTTFKNKIINGDGVVAQRGTTAPITVSINYVSLDRWCTYQPTVGSCFLNQEVTDRPTGFSTSMRMGRTSGVTQVGAIQMWQALETYQARPLQGKQVTFSFYAKKGADFSAASSHLGNWLYSGTGVDQNAASFGSWPGLTAVTAANSVLTTSWQRFSYTGTVPTNCNQLTVVFSVTTTGTAGADDSIYITGVQLEEGAIASSYDTRPYGVELALCQRYFYKHSPHWTGVVASGGNVGRLGGPHPVAMRVTPTLTLGGTVLVFDGVTGSAVSSVSAGYSTVYYAEYDLFLTVALTAGNAAIMYISAGTVSLNAEL